MPLETLENVKLGLQVSGTADDDLLTRLLQAADAFIAQYCGRTFRTGTHTEHHPGGAQILYLQNFPVQTVVSLAVDAGEEFPPGSVRPASTYRVHRERGVIENKDGTFVPSLPGWRISDDHFPGAVRVVYTTETSIVPAAVQRACVELVAHWFKQVKTLPATQYQNLIEKSDGTNISTFAWGQSSGFKLPEGVLQLLRPFRVPAM